MRRGVDGGTRVWNDERRMVWRGNFHAVFLGSGHRRWGISDKSTDETMTLSKVSLTA